jgi:hypothetical protein
VFARVERLDAPAEALDQLAPNALRQLLQVRLEQLYGSLGDVHA